MWSTSAIAAPWFVGAALGLTVLSSDDAYLAGPCEELLNVLRRERERTAGRPTEPGRRPVDQSSPRAI